jgi:hypothetical protein
MPSPCEPGRAPLGQPKVRKTLDTTVLRHVVLGDDGPGLGAGDGPPGSLSEG